MKRIVVFDKEGKVLASVPCDESTKSARCMIADVNHGAVVDGVDLTNARKPVAIWHNEMTDKELERYELVKGIADQVGAGASLRELIGAMNLSDSEKWKLEEEVKSYGI